jgi:hypothetical protein
VHWHLGTDQVSLTDPAQLLLDEAASRTLFDAVSGLFTSEGFLMHWGAPLRWYIAHESLAGLATASIDRVIGRNVDRWLPAGPPSRLLRRLQNEVQMLLYTHPLNAEREARGQPPVNSFWLSGCGVAQAAAGEVCVDERLRRCALAEDWPGWATAWAQVDDESAGPGTDAPDAVRRTRGAGLCAAAAGPAGPAGARWPAWTWPRELGGAVTVPTPP